MCKVVALTGGIGSGKSAVSSYLRERGVPVYDSDSRTKQLYDDDPSIVDALEKELSVSLRDPEGRFDRRALASVIFSSQEALSKVEAIVHPAVLEDFRRWIGTVPEEWCGYAGQPKFVVMESAIVLDKPLFDGVFDAVVVVDAPLQMRVERASKRDGVDAEAIMKRIGAQVSHVGDADAVINNDLDLETLRERTDIAFNLLYL